MITVIIAIKLYELPSDNCWHSGAPQRESEKIVPTLWALWKCLLSLDVCLIRSPPLRLLIIISYNLISLLPDGLSSSSCCLVLCYGLELFLCWLGSWETCELWSAIHQNRATQNWSLAASPSSGHQRRGNKLLSPRYWWAEMSTKPGLPGLLFFPTLSYYCCRSVTESPDSSATPWAATCQLPLSMEFLRRGHQSGSSFPSLGELPNLGIGLVSLAL